MNPQLFDMTLVTRSPKKSNAIPDNCTHATTCNATLHNCNARKMASCGADGRPDERVEQWTAWCRAGQKAGHWRGDWDWSGQFPGGWACLGKMVELPLLRSGVDRNSGSGPVGRGGHDQGCAEPFLQGPRSLHALIASAFKTTLGSVFALPSRRVIEQCELENGNRQSAFPA